MVFVSGWLRTHRRGPGSPVDPDYGIDEGAHPDHDLPGGGFGGGHPSHPIARPGWGRPVDPGYGVGEEHPDQGLPPGEPEVPPGFPDNSLPAIPVYPSHQPVYPGLPIYPVPPGTPTHPIVPPPPGAVWPPLPQPPTAGQLPSGQPPVAGQLPSGDRKVLLALIWLRGAGWRYIAVDPNAKWPDNTLPPTAQPK
jgi:hypothetical protein